MMTDAERQRRLGDKANLLPFVGTIFPNTSYHGRQPRALCVWHPHGPEQTEIWRFFLVDKDARILGKYRKIHLPGHGAVQPGRPGQHLEKLSVLIRLNSQSQASLYLLINKLRSHIFCDKFNFRLYLFPYNLSFFFNFGFGILEQ